MRLEKLYLTIKEMKFDEQLSNIIVNKETIEYVSNLDLYKVYSHAFRGKLAYRLEIGEFKNIKDLMAFLEKELEIKEDTQFEKRYGSK